MGFVTTCKGQEKTALVGKCIIQFLLFVNTIVLTFSTKVWYMLHFMQTTHTRFNEKARVKRPFVRGKFTAKMKTSYEISCRLLHQSEKRLAIYVLETQGRLISSC